MGSHSQSRTQCDGLRLNYLIVANSLAAIDCFFLFWRLIWISLTFFWSFGLSSKIAEYSCWKALISCMPYWNTFLPFLHFCNNILTKGISGFYDDWMYIIYMYIFRNVKPVPCKTIFKIQIALLLNFTKYKLIYYSFLTKSCHMQRYVAI